MFRMQRATNNNNNSNNSNGSSTTTPTGVHQACASCKHQRKKCGEDCVLAPFFPADKNKEFQAVHKVFGVANVTKLVRGVNQEDRKLVADSLVWEAFCRQNDPILGPLGEYRKIQEELKLYKSQNQIVLNDNNNNNNNNQLVQQYKPPPSSGVIGFNGGTNGISNKGSIGVELGTNNIVAYGHDNGIVDPMRFGYPMNFVHGPDQKLKPDKELGPRHIHLQPQQLHPTNGFNQNFLLSGQYPITGKTMDSSMWEDKS
ncbi:hypothetical protein Tsubulata_019502 [Turnera subulata]|uniref:LOB domain-containing protein n=1 Tax=Turnera subulata TaxID=218843 RepID=A0A9Q0FUY6_9ROSI|nr:hypothetical protein Tsubulata_019502 [Turnera subulata]